MKQESIAIDKKTTLDLKTTVEKLPVAGIVVIIGVACAIGISLFLFWHHSLSSFVQVSVFIAAGLLYVSTTHKGLYNVASAGEWIFTFVAAGLIFVFLAVLSIWKLELPMHLILSSACAFLVPFTITEIWRAHLQLALDGIKIWYPTSEMLSKYPTFYFNSTPMRFRVMQGKGKLGVTIKFKVSNEMPLGKIYYDLVQNKADKTGKEIALSDARRQYYRWIFYTADSLFLTRPLDPEKTLHQNGLHKRNVIYVQRISQNDIDELNAQQNKVE